MTQLLLSGFFLFTDIFLSHHHEWHGGRWRWWSRGEWRGESRESTEHFCKIKWRRFTSTMSYCQITRHDFEKAPALFGSSGKDDYVQKGYALLRISMELPWYKDTPGRCFAEVWIQNFYIIDWMQLCNINVLTSSLREDDQLFCTCDLEGFRVSLSETKGLTKAVWEILTFSRVSHWRKFLNLRADPSH